MGLARHFLSEGRIITTDNFFTSSRLGKMLWDNKTKLLGTIRKNRIGNPQDFMNEEIKVPTICRYQKKI